MAVQVYVVCFSISKLSVSAIIKYFGSGWALQCSCHGIYTHNTVPSRATTILMSPLISILVFSTYAAIAAWRPDTRDRRLQGSLLHTPTAVRH